MFFHISYHDHGEYFQFVPKLPELAVVHKEGNIPRVCVSTNIYNCLHSLSSMKKLYSFDILLNCKHVENTHYQVQPMVYMVIGNQTPYLPPNASDFRLRDEHWFITPVVMKRIGCVDLIELLKGNIVVNSEITLLDRNDTVGPGKDVLISKRKKEKYRDDFNELVDLSLFINQNYITSFYPE